MQRAVDLKKEPAVLKPLAPTGKVKHSLFVVRTEEDKFIVSIEGTNDRHDVRLLLRAVEKEVNIRRRRAIPLSQSAEV